MCVAAAALGCSASAVVRTTGAESATTTTTTTVPKGDPGQAFFHDALIKDPKTTSAVRKALQADAAIVDPATQYADLTGDGKSDAIVRVHSAGAAGVIAVYVFSTDGAPKGALRAVFRTQSLYRAVTAPTNDDKLQIDEPRYAPGDDLCCPVRLTRRRYRFAKAGRTFVRTSLETITLRERP
jgi:hypothetical protein